MYQENSSFPISSGGIEMEQNLPNHISCQSTAEQIETLNK